jgi:hypothetical protein
MPASWANAFWPTTALFRWTDWPVTCASLRLTGYSSFVLMPGAQRHHDLFEGRVAGPLADPVDGTLDLPRPLAQGRQGVRDRQPEVVVAVDGQHAGVDPADLLFQVPHDGRVVGGHGVPDRVGDVERGGPGLDHALDDFGQEVELGAGRVLRRELHVGAPVARPLHPLDRPPGDLLGRHPQLELAVDGAGGEEHVDAGPLGVLDGVGGAVDVGRVAPGQPGDDRPADLAGDRLDALEVARRRDREPGLDRVHPELRERPGHLQLLAAVHAAPGALLPVPQRGVENDDAVRVGRHGHTQAS